ncbi:MAG TPA: hypothetical protein VE915_09955 [Actinomycetota bacterium]|jgi:hypothetical protein|nr:hypothetical protein [Actinomycetota bacterium]
MNRRLWVAAFPLIAALLLSSCGEPVSDEHIIDEPATLEEVEGTELTRVTLTQRAAERLDIQTAPVEALENRLVVPFSAVLVDPEGVFWVYTSPEPLVFLRHEISIVHEEGDQTFLSAGPPVGTAVVTVGVPELYGAETEIGH